MVASIIPPSAFTSRASRWHTATPARTGHGAGRVGASHPTEFAILRQRRGGEVELVERPVAGLAPALLIGVLLASLEMAIVNAVLPKVASDLRDAGLLPWVFTSYIAATTVATPLFGILADRLGRRSTYAIGMGLVLAGSVAAATAPTMPALLAGRVLQGLGAGGLIPITIVIFGDRYDIAERARMFGAISLVWGAATLGGPLVGAHLTGWFGWRSVFWINLPPGLIALAGVWWALRGEVPPAAAPRSRWRDMFATPTQRWLGVSGALAVAALHGVLAFVAAWVQGVKAGTPLDAGFALLPLTLAWTAASQVTGRLVPRLGLGRLIRWGHATLAIGLGVGWYWTMEPPGLVLVGVAMGMLVTCLNLAIQESAPPALRGTATSAAIFLRNLAATVAVPTFGWLAGFRPGVADLRQVPGLADGITVVMAASALIAALAWLAVVAWVPRRLAMGHG